MGERVVYVDVAALGEGVEHAWVGIDRVVVIMRGEASGRSNVTGIARPLQSSSCAHRVLRDAVRCRSLRHVRNPICRAVLIDIVVLVVVCWGMQAELCKRPVIGEIV